MKNMEIAVSNDFRGTMCITVSVRELNCLHGALVCVVAWSCGLQKLGGADFLSMKSWVPST